MGNVLGVEFKEETAKTCCRFGGVLRLKSWFTRRCMCAEVVSLSFSIHIKSLFCKYDVGRKWLNPRLTGGLLQPPLRFFPGCSKTLKKVTKGI